MPSHILAIDQGTTSTRAVVFDARGREIAAVAREFPQHYPADGWVEHDPEDIWRDTQAVMREAVERAGLAPAAIAAIGITNQRETCLLWDRATGEPVHRAIVWQDRRTAAFCAELKAAGHEPAVQAKTGLLLDPYFSATKLRWLLDLPGVRTRAELGELAFGTIDSFLLWRLTGGRTHATDATNASRTMLFDIHAQQWDAELLALFAVPPSVLPDVRDSSADFGWTDALGPPIPIRGVAGDQQAALVGQACFAPGEVKSTYGTGCFALSNTGDSAVASTNRLLTTVGYRLSGRPTYAIEGSIFVAGAAIKWLRDQLGLITRASDTHGLAAQVPDNGGVYLVPAFVGLGAPHWRPDARAMLSGMTLATSAAHVARAALESVAYQTADLMAAMAGDGAPAATVKVDGGMAANDWFCQFLADVLDRPVDRPADLESTARVAEFVAGLGPLWPDLAALAALPREVRRFEPAMAAPARAALMAGWRTALARALA